jgi:glycosyltransferase involved in cell wall biosynthesis
MKITVILCTYNRCASLPRVLESVAAQILPESVDWEVIVVDNNSTDQTRAVAEDFCRRYPNRFRYLFEQQQGLSRARNAGIRAAYGDVIAFTDDDVKLDSNWLRNLTASLHNNAWSGAGGRILPEQTYRLPPWLSTGGRYALAPLALFDLGTQVSELQEPPFGANMAFRKIMFEKYGFFRTDLGRCGNSLLSNEDTEFGRRLMLAGERLRFEPSAIIYHPVVQDRLKKEYFLAWWYDKARADIRTFGLPKETKLQIAGVPLYFFRRLIIWTLRWITAISPARRFSCKLKVWMGFGGISECYRLSAQTKHQADKSKA